MATAVCGCECHRERDGVWRIVDAAEDCPFAHRLGQLGLEQGTPERVRDVGECITVVFERASRTALLVTVHDGRSVASAVENDVFPAAERPARGADASREAGRSTARFCAIDGGEVEGLDRGGDEASEACFDGALDEEIQDEIDDEIDDGIDAMPPRRLASRA